MLENPDYRTVPEEDAPNALTETAEYVLYNRLRDDGWIMEVANRRSIEVHMPREAHALLSSLITLKEELKVDISAESSLIDSGILAAYQDPAGKVMLRRGLHASDIAERLWDFEAGLIEDETAKD